MCGHVWTQEKREMQNREKAKRTIIQRIRKSIHTTIDPETYEFIKNVGLNAGKMLDTAISELRTKTKAELVLILKNTQKECLHPELNRGQPDLQSGALPTEL